ncbi:thiosulfate/3-mercaptopyruvate sulfurtransferase [Pedobacter sp. UYP30]|uniref:sulfurtransferase n=1 Tax=Pedobacter sp. UYP30 TaxID=1756400 RepID=UPI003399D1CA
MSKILSPVIQAVDLVEIYHKEKIVLIDATNAKNARENYQAKHLKGALFVDLNTQLADVKSDVANGGRHPLPTLKSFTNTLASLGISEESNVVVYDEQNGSNAAARFWWMLKSIGHKKVQVSDGGFTQAEKIGFPLSDTLEVAEKVPSYKASKWMLPLAGIEEVENIARDEKHLIIDVRDSERFKGKIEPIDLIAGHIPGAINIPFSTNLNDGQLFLSPQELRQKYQIIFAEKHSQNIIVHCGSGVTACHTLLAVAYAGLKIPKLYIGSWSEWSRNSKLIATEE